MEKLLSLPKTKLTMKKKKDPKNPPQSYEAYLKNSIKNTSEEDVDKTIDKKEKILHKFKDTKFLERYAQIGKQLFSMLIDYSRGRYRQVPWMSIAAISVALLYILNPLDLLPDFIPGLGYIDDVSIFMLVLRLIENDLHQYLDWKIEKADQESEVER